MEKRLATLSCRVPCEIDAAIHAIAAMRDTTVSDLLCQLCQELVERERERYYRLRPLFESVPDLPGRPPEEDA